MSETVNKTIEPCCPPAPLIESAIGEDRDGNTQYRFTFHTFDGKRTMDLMYVTMFCEDWDALELICSRCGKAVSPEILFGPDKAYHPAFQPE